MDGPNPGFRLIRRRHGGGYDCLSLPSTFLWSVCCSLEWSSILLRTSFSLIPIQSELILVCTEPRLRQSLDFQGTTAPRPSRPHPSRRRKHRRNIGWEARMPEARFFERQDRPLGTAIVDKSQSIMMIVMWPSRSTSGIRRQSINGCFGFSMIQGSGNSDFCLKGFLE